MQLPSTPASQLPAVDTATACHDPNPEVACCVSGRPPASPQLLTTSDLEHLHTPLPEFTTWPGESARPECRADPEASRSSHLYKGLQSLSLREMRVEGYNPNPTPHTLLPLRYLPSPPEHTPGPAACPLQALPLPVSFPPLIVLPAKTFQTGKLSVSKAFYFGGTQTRIILNALQYGTF